jgi:hypothetical protein
MTLAVFWDVDPCHLEDKTDVSEVNTVSIIRMMSTLHTENMRYSNIFLKAEAWPDQWHGGGGEGWPQNRAREPMGERWEL